MSSLAQSLFVCIVYILMLQNTISLPGAVWPPLKPEHKVSAIYQSLRRRATMAMRDQNHSQGRSRWFSHYSLVGGGGGVL